MHGVEEHVRGQVPRAVLLEAEQARALGPGGDDHGVQPAFQRVSCDDHDRARHRGVAGEHGLDLAELDAVTADLDHVVDTAHVLQFTVRADPSDVPGPVRASLSGASPVAEHHRGPRHHDLAFLVGGVEGDRVPGGRAADGQRACPLEIGLRHLVGGAHVRLGGPVPVEQPYVGPASAHRLGLRDGERFAA